MIKYVAFPPLTQKDGATYLIPSVKKKVSH